MSNVFSDVGAFQIAAGQRVAVTPEHPDEDLAALRKALMEEELTETLDALRAVSERPHVDTFANLAKELCDLIYVAAGAGTSILGTEVMQDAWREVQKSNMSKVGPDGKLLFAPNGKVLKPEDYVAPDIEWIVYKALSGWMDPV